MAKIEIDDRRWPILRITFPREFTQAEFDEHLRTVLAHARRGEPFGIFNDARAGGHPNAAQRRQMTDAMLDRDLRRNLRAVAIVISQPWLKNIMQALLLFMPKAMCVFEHFSGTDADYKAFAWLREQLRSYVSARKAG